MREDRPRNLKDMLAEAKNTSELMVDLAYAALFYNSEDFSEEVFRLEERLNDLVYDMRSLAILAARSPADSEQMAGILQVVQDIEKIGNAAYDIAKIVVKKLGIPPELLQDLPAAEGVAEIRRLAGEGSLGTTDGVPVSSEGLSELERAVDILIEMKNLSEVAVGLAYSALLYYDAGLAREVVAIEDEMDEMRYRLERWVLLAARRVEDASRLRGVLHLATASEAIADCAQEMVWIVEKGEEVHPVLSAAVEESDEIVLKLTVVPGSPADGRTLKALHLETETGMHALAVNRGGRWTYRPRDTYTLQGGDSLLATGAPEGLEPLAELFGQGLEMLEE